MISRNIEPVLRRMAAQFKAVAITGPRQSGKTTLSRKVFTEKPYVSLEAPDERARALRDPRQFLDRFPEGCILDEVQRAPELFSYLQGRLDAASEAGQFILTGSQQFDMMAQISQTLAGRIGMLKLLPFAYDEIPAGRTLNLNEVLWQGAYPPIFDQNIDPAFWYDAYIATYVERDVRQILNVQDTQLFQRFLALCSGNIGQLFNASRIGNDCGLNHGTVSKWLSVLEASYIAFRLPPHHQNFRKRLVKTPKIYFYDLGLAIRLLGIETAQQLATHPLRGALFENWVILEVLKAIWNQGQRSQLFFWRTNTGQEIDLLIEQAGQLTPVEIKSGQTFATDWLHGLEKWLDLSGTNPPEPSIIYGGLEHWNEGQIQIRPWHQAASLVLKR
jgi:predicted AAA+ superfamily ATPase